MKDNKNNINIDKNKTCCFSGHRKLEEDFNLVKLKNAVDSVIDRGYDTFLVGMALGFDSVAFQVLENIKKEKNIKIIACIPCRSQAYKFTFREKQEYSRMLNVADEKIYLANEYTPYCMMQRNMFMVDNSSVLITYLRKYSGGAYNTVYYAKTKEIEIINV